MNLRETSTQGAQGLHRSPPRRIAPRAAPEILVRDCFGGVQICRRRLACSPQRVIGKVAISAQNMSGAPNKPRHVFFSEEENRRAGENGRLGRQARPGESPVRYNNFNPQFSSKTTRCQQKAQRRLERPIRESCGGHKMAPVGIFGAPRRPSAGGSCEGAIPKHSPSTVTGCGMGGRLARNQAAICGISPVICWAVKLISQRKAAFDEGEVMLGTPRANNR